MSRRRHALPFLGLPLWAGLTLSSCAPGAPVLRAAFGFQANYEVPDPDHSGHLVPESYPWSEGPHALFQDLDPRQLALESLAWFEEAPAATKWRGSASARLELVYPSQAMTVTARHLPGAELDWKQQLEGWFERFPPGGSGAREVRAVDFPWTIGFGTRGEVCGVAASDQSALEALQAMVAHLGSLAQFSGPSFSMLTTVRRSSNEMDVYGVEAASAAELEDLPRRLREERLQNAR